jgi:hypothetical protein
MGVLSARNRLTLEFVTNDRDDREEDDGREGQSISTRR